MTFIYAKWTCWSSKSWRRRRNWICSCHFKAICMPWGGRGIHCVLGRTPRREVYSIRLYLKNAGNGFFQSDSTRSSKEKKIDQNIQLFRGKKSEIEVEVGKKVETRRERVTRARELFLIDKPRSFSTFLRLTSAFFPPCKPANL